MGEHAVFTWLEDAWSTIKALWTGARRFNPTSIKCHFHINIPNVARNVSGNNVFALAELRGLLYCPLWV